MDEKKVICKRLRKEFGTNGWALLIYYGIMNAAVMLVSILDGLVYAMQLMLDPNADPSYLEAELAQRLLENGWGYVLATVVGAVILLLWKKKDFCLRQIWKTEKGMTPGDFFRLLVVFFSGQALFQLLTPLLEWLFSLMGFSLQNFVDSASMSGDSLSMFLYACLLAPIFEEVLFRGLVMRSLEPYGRKFAILGSAFLFGIFHGNLVQTPYAFAVGLVLGYVAMEYSMGWAMVLHMINNLLLGDTLYRLTGSSSELIQQIVFAVVIWGLSIAGLVVLICKRKAIADYFRRWKTHPFCWRCFFTAPGILALCVVMIANIVLTLFL